MPYKNPEDKRRWESETPRTEKRAAQSAAVGNNDPTLSAESRATIRLQTRNQRMDGNCFWAWGLHSPVYWLGRSVPRACLKFANFGC
jgi:hypothetical protein